MFRGIKSFLSGNYRVDLKTQQIQYFMIFLLGLYHFVMIALYFTLFGMNPMSMVNILSVLIYFLCYFSAKKKKYDVAYYLCFGEVVGYYLAANYIFGLGYGFNLYLIGLLAASYFASYIFSTEKKQIAIIRFLAIILAAFLASVLISGFHNPILGTDKGFSYELINWINFVTCACALVLFSATFMSRINVLENRLKSQNTEFKKMSMRDALTGLVNRRYLRNKYTELDAKEEVYSVIIADIDDFKKVNDTYGHETGDKVLVAVSKIFKEFVRGSDFVCRWGGEEILILMPVCTRKQAKRVGVQLLEEVQTAEVESANGEKVSITITMGLADSTEGEQFMHTFRVADRRLYLGKRSGKNCIVDHD